MTEEIKRPPIASKRYMSKRTHHTLLPHFLLLLNKKTKKRIFPKGVETEIVNTKPREKRQSVPYIEMSDLLYVY